MANNKQLDSKFGPDSERFGRGPGLTHSIVSWPFTTGHALTKALMRPWRQIASMFGRRVDRPAAMGPQINHTTRVITVPRITPNF